jgi:hypothetical protein
MLGDIALKSGLRIAYAVLFLGAVWLVLTVSGELGVGAQRLVQHLPPPLLLTAALAIPVLAALSSLHIKIDLRIRIASLLVLLICVPLLPFAFNSHPIVVVVVLVIFTAEEYVIIPLINQKLVRREDRNPGNRTQVAW